MKKFNSDTIVSVEIQDFTVEDYSYEPASIHWIWGYDPGGFVTPYGLNKISKERLIDSGTLVIDKENIVRRKPYVEITFVNGVTQRKWFDNYGEAKDYYHKILSLFTGVMIDQF